MTPPTHVLRFRSLLLSSAATIALIATAVPASARAQSGPQAIMIGDTWSGWISQGIAVQTAMPTGGIGAQVTIHTNYLAPALLEFLASSVAGKSALTKVLLATYTAAGAPLSGIRTGATRVQEIELPAADARNTGPALLGVKFVQATSEQSRPTTWPSVNPRGQELHANLFHLTFDSLDANTTMTVAPMAIAVEEVVKGARLPMLVVTTGLSNTGASQNWSAGLQKWFASRTAKNGTLTFLAQDMRTPLLVERFQGVRVVSISSGTTTPTVTFSMTGIRLQSAVTP